MHAGSDKEDGVYPLSVIAIIAAVPGTRDALRDRLDIVLRESDEVEPGLLWWSLAESLDDADGLSAVELFTDRAAYAAHQSRPEVVAATKDMLEIVVSATIYLGAAIGSTAS